MSFAKLVEDVGRSEDTQKRLLQFEKSWFEKYKGKVLNYGSHGSRITITISKLLGDNYELEDDNGFPRYTHRVGVVFMNHGGAYDMYSIISMTGTPERQAYWNLVNDHEVAIAKEHGLEHDEEFG